MRQKIRSFFRGAVLSMVLVASSSFAVTPAELKIQYEQSDPAFVQNATQYAKANPKNADAQLWLVRAQLRSNQGDAAIKTALATTKLAPQNSDAYLWLANAYGVAIARAGMLGKMSLAGKLHEALEKSVALNANQLEARQGLIQFYLQAPAMMGGGRDKALMQVAEIAKRDAAQGHLARATVAIVDEKPELALQEYEAAFALKPTDKTIRMRLGVGYQNAKRWADAHALFTDWITQDPTASGAWYQIGRTAALGGNNLAEGEAALKKYLTMPISGGEPEKQHALFRLGQVQIKMAKKAEAKANLQAALKLDGGLKEAAEELKKL